MNWRTLNKNTMSKANGMFTEFYKTDKSFVFTIYAKKAEMPLYPFFALFSFK